MVTYASLIGYRQPLLAIIHFNNTALFIVYDEGQKHDKSGFGSGTYAVTGGRLPLILVSPFANNGYVSPTEYTH